MLKDEIIDEILGAENPGDAIERVYSIARDLRNARNLGKNVNIYEIEKQCRQLYALMKVVIEEFNIGIILRDIEITTSTEENIDLILRVFDEMKPDTGRMDVDNWYKDFKTRAKARYDKKFCYEIPDNDLQRAQQIFNELRDLFSNSTFFDEDHKRRLLDKLERMQRELHKRVSDFDRWLGLAIDIAKALGEAGTEAKPIVDRIRELLDIARRAQSKVEKLPDPKDILPLLESPKGDDK